MKNSCLIKDAVRTKSCEIAVAGKQYIVIGQYARHGVEKAEAVYYLIREDMPELAIQCGSSTAAVHYLDNNFADFWFWADVQKYGCLMVERYENEVLKIRKVG